MSRNRGGDYRGGNNGINSVFYSDVYHPIQAGSIDGTDILPHDNAVYRAFLCSSAGLYDPNGDPKIIGDPHNTLFVGHLSPYTNEDSLLKAMSRYGRVKNLRLVRHIVTGASRGYAFVEYETAREMRHAYEDANHAVIDDSEIIVDFNRQQLMPGWIPRRLGGGLGGRKESGQLRFGGRERPFRAPLRPIPWDDLRRLGIPLPPEGRYVSRFQIPPLPRRRSPPKDQNAAMGDKGGRSLRRSSDSPGFSVEQQLERTSNSRPSKRLRERSSRESQHYEHVYSSDEDLRCKHQQRHGGRHDHQLHRKQSSRMDHLAASSDMTETSSYAPDSIEKCSDERLGHRWNSESFEKRRGKTSGVGSSYEDFYSSDEDVRKRDRLKHESSDDHKRHKKHSGRHDTNSDTGEH